MKLQILPDASRHKRLPGRVNLEINPDSTTGQPAATEGLRIPGFDDHRSTIIPDNCQLTTFNEGYRLLAMVKKNS